MLKVTSEVVISELCVCSRRVDAAGSSEGSFRTSSSGGCDGDWSSPAAESLTHQQLNCAGASSNLASHDVTRRFHGNADDCGSGDWRSQRWRHWQQMTMLSSFETNEQLTLV